MNLPGYDAWKLATPPEYEADAPECECDHSEWRRCECECHRSATDPREYDREDDDRE